MNSTNINLKVMFDRVLYPSPILNTLFKKDFSELGENKETKFKNQNQCGDDIGRVTMRNDKQLNPTSTDSKRLIN